MTIAEFLSNYGSWFFFLFFPLGLWLIKLQARIQELESKVDHHNVDIEEMKAMLRETRDAVIRIETAMQIQNQPQMKSSYHGPG